MLIISNNLLVVGIIDALTLVLKLVSCLVALNTSHFRHCHKQILGNGTECRAVNASAAWRDLL